MEGSRRVRRRRERGERDRPWLRLLGRLVVRVAGVERNLDHLDKDFQGKQVFIALIFNISWLLKHLTRRVSYNLKKFTTF